MDASPDASAARAIAERLLDQPVQRCERFPTGLRHWVYDVETTDGRRIVVRLAHPDHRLDLAGGRFWMERLRKMGMPVPELLAADVDGPQPYLVLHRLPGTDLGNVHDELTIAQLRGIALAVLDLQAQTATLDPARGFGYARNYEESLNDTWLSVLEASVGRAERWIAAAAVVDPALPARVRQSLAAAAASFGDVTPTAFLHDATTKNVIVADGRLSGLVDVDEMAFGDPLWTVALTRMSLLAAGRSTYYTEVQADALRPIDNPCEFDERLDLYTALHGLTFLGEIGQTFNRATAAPIDHEYRHRLEHLVDGLLT